MASDDDESAMPNRLTNYYGETDDNTEGKDAEDAISDTQNSTTNQNSGWDTTPPSRQSNLSGSKTGSRLGSGRDGAYNRSVPLPKPRPPTRSRSPSFARERSHPSTEDDGATEEQPLRKSASYNEISRLDGYEPLNLTSANRKQVPLPLTGNSGQRWDSVDDNDNDKRSASPEAQWSDAMVVRAYLRSRPPSQNEEAPAPVTTEDTEDVQSTTEKENENENPAVTPTPPPIKEENLKTPVNTLHFPTPPPNPSRVSVSRSFRSAASKQHSARQSRSTKKGRRYLSRLSTSSYFHDDILDENLIISASKLDNTLLRLFSNTRKVSKNAEDADDPSAKLMPFLNYSDSDLISMDPVMWRVYPMDSVQKETLDQEMTYLEENLQPRDILSKLYKDEILTLMDYNQITRTEGQGNKAVTRLLIKTVQRRGEKAYPALLKALQANNHKDVCDRLSGTERNLREGMIEDNKERIRPAWRNLNIATPYKAGDPSSRRSSNNALFPTILTSPTYRISSLDNAPTTSQMALRTDNPSSPNHWSKPCPVTISEGQDENYGPDIDSEQLEKYLRDLKAELEALHEDVTALKSARSFSQTGGGQSSRNERESVEQRPESPANEPLPSAEIEDNNDIDTVQSNLPAASAAPKSSTCTLL